MSDANILAVLILGIFRFLLSNLTFTYGDVTFKILREEEKNVLKNILYMTKKTRCTSGDCQLGEVLI